MARCPALALLVLALVWPVAAAAELYRWTDTRGVVHLTQDLTRVPVGLRARAVAAARTAPAATSRFQSFESPSRAAPGEPRRATTSAGRRIARTSASPGRQLVVPFERHGTMMLVQVRLNDRVTAPFFVDTGASDVAIPARVARQAGIVVGRETPRVLYQTPGGPTANPVVTIDRVSVGDAQVENVRAHVSEMMDIGLLGATFFNNFTMHIDPASNELLLSHNDRVRSAVTEDQWRQRFRGLHTRMDRLDRYLGENDFTSDVRVQQLEQRRAALDEALAALESEADRAAVPQRWRE